MPFVASPIARCYGCDALFLCDTLSFSHSVHDKNTAWFVPSCYVFASLLRRLRKWGLEEERSGAHAKKGNSYSTYLVLLSCRFLEVPIIPHETWFVCDFKRSIRSILIEQWLCFLISLLSPIFCGLISDKKTYRCGTKWGIDWTFVNNLTYCFLCSPHCNEVVSQFGVHLHLDGALYRIRWYCKYASFWRKLIPNKFLKTASFFLVSFYPEISTEFGSLPNHLKNHIALCVYELASCSLILTRTWNSFTLKMGISRNGSRHEFASSNKFLGCHYEEEIPKFHRMVEFQSVAQVGF